MGRFNLSFGHVEGTNKHSKLVFQQLETTGKGLLILLGNVAAAAAAFVALILSLRGRKK